MGGFFLVRGREVGCDLVQNLFWISLYGLNFLVQDFHDWSSGAPT